MHAECPAINSERNQRGRLTISLVGLTIGDTTSSCNNLASRLAIGYYALSTQHMSLITLD